MPNLSPPLAPLRGRCFVVLGSGSGDPELADIIPELRRLGWEPVEVRDPHSVRSLPGTVGVGDLVLAGDPSGVDAAGLAAVRDRALVAGIIGPGGLSPETAAVLDVVLCANPGMTGPLRSLGKAAHFVAPGHLAAGRRADILSRHARYRQERGRYAQVDWSRVSYGHEAISVDQVSGNMVKAWQSDDIPARQRALVQTELREMYLGRTPRVYQVLAEALAPYAVDGLGVLEIGCASGYYSEILEYLLNRRLNYAGIDYSPGLLRMARSFYPSKPFIQADGARLPLRDGAYPVAISSCVLLHVPNFRDHVRETCRVSGGIIIAHRTPVARRRPTQHMRKFAYGVETVELVFNEGEILREFEAGGFRPSRSIEFHSQADADEYTVTYILEKSAAPKASGSDPGGATSGSAIGSVNGASAAPTAAHAATPAPVSGHASLPGGNPLATSLSALIAAAGRTSMQPPAHAAQPAVDPGELDRLLGEGEKSYASGDLGHARSLFSRVDALDPHNPRLLNNLGVLACEDGDLSKAERLFRGACEGQPRNRNFLINLAEVLGALGREDEAHRMYGLFLQRSGEDQEVRRRWRESSDAGAGAPVQGADTAGRPSERGGRGGKPAVRVLWQNRDDMESAPGGDTTVVREITAALKELGAQVDVSLAESPALGGHEVVHLNNISRTRDTLAHLENARRAGKPTVLIPLYEDMDRYLVPAMKTDLLFRYLAMKGKILPLEGLRQVREGFELQEHPLENPVARHFGIGDTTKQRAILNGVDRIITSGKRESESIRRKFAPSAPITEMAYGFNRAFQDARPDLFTSRHGLRDFALCVGRLEPRKNQWQLMEVFRGLPRLTLVCIGVFSDPSMEPLIKAYAPPNVRFFSRLPFEELVSAYAAARVHVLPSWYELPGLVSLEAAAAGCRIVSTDWGTAPDYLGDKAVYCSPEDPLSIRAAVLKAFDTQADPTLRSHVLEHFSWKRAAAGCLATYEELLSR